MRRAMLAALATAAAAATLPAGAQNWPSRPVRVLVPYPPGSGTDIIGRVLAEKLQAAWGQPVVVENRPGGGGTIGTEAGARAAPDGHTFLISDVGPLAMAPSLYARLPYDPVRDFEAVGLVARLPFVLVTHPAVPAARPPSSWPWRRRGPAGSPTPPSATAAPPTWPWSCSAPPKGSN